jgi:mono/diheme cytochrome c family protein
MESDEIRKTRQIDKKTKWFLISGTAVSAMLAGAFGWLYFDRLDEPAQDAEAPLQIDWMFIDAGDVDLVIEGRKVYEAHCADCHGYRLEGQPNWQRRAPDGVLPAPPHDEMPQGVKSGMPAYRDILSDREIEAALAYIKSRWPSKIRRQHEMRTNQSR